MRRPAGDERGSASVEQAALAALVALLLAAAVSAVLAGGEVEAGRRLAGAIAGKIKCAPRLPDGCRHHPLVPADDCKNSRLSQ